jgi:hypothetical protein
MQRTVCVLTTPNDPWLGKLIEDKGDVLLVEDVNGIVREISTTECEILDEGIQP